MSPRINVHINPTPQKKVMVISHERSGTHFLMNSIALNFGYNSQQFISFDDQLALNFHSLPAIEQFFRGMHDKPVLNIIKSHHPVEFLQELLHYLKTQFFIFYIYRDPRDVMTSYWKMLPRLQWDEGPITKTVGEFMRAQPRGRILRYQKEQIPSMLERWQKHVEGWMGYFRENANPHYITIHYNDLHQEFEKTMHGIAERLQKPLTLINKPRPGVNVVVPGKGEIGSHKEFFTPEDHEFVRSTVGKTMQMLGIA